MAGYMSNIDYLNSRFLDGQLRIEDERKGVVFQGDIKSFSVKGNIATVVVAWLAKGNLRGEPDWVEDSSRGPSFDLDLRLWDDTCHGEGRIGLERHGDDEVFLIVPRHHSSIIARPQPAPKQRTSFVRGFF